MDGKMGSSAPGHGLSIENAFGSRSNLGKENRQPAVLICAWLISAYAGVDQLPVAKFALSSDPFRVLTGPHGYFRSTIWSARREPAI